MAGASAGNRVRKASQVKKQGLLGRIGNGIRNGVNRVRRFFA